MNVICNYCGKPAKFVDSTVVYGSSYGMIYYCKDCKAWVGVHKGSTTPLGTLANAELRACRRKAHGMFDRIWRRRWMSRRKAYAWLSEQMGLSTEETHIGMFTVEQCRTVIDLCIRFEHEHIKEDNHGRKRDQLQRH